MTSTQVNIKNLNGDVYLADSPEVNVDSVINSVIFHLSQYHVIIDPRKRTTIPRVILKIEHNNLVRNVFIAHRYQFYSSHVESAYSTLDKAIVGGRQTAMLTLDSMYRNALHAYNIDYYSPDMSLLRSKADDIIDHIRDNLTKFLYKSANVLFSKEQMILGVDLVIAHAFVECFVLVNPNDPI